MNTFFQRTLTRLGHLSDETITKFIDGELSSLHEFRVKAHLGKCWQCKARRETLEKAAFQVVEYRKHKLESHLPLSSKRREMFFEHLDKVLEETTTAPWWSRVLSQLRSVSIPHMNPVFSSTFVIVAAVVLLVLIWQRNTVPVSASIFLEKAVQEEAQQSSPTLSGVIYQKVEIKTKSKTIERGLYRDISHQRRPRAEKVATDEDGVRKQLDAAGVDWQQPLSAGAFKMWHDRQLTAEDDVRRSGNDLLTLTTALPSGPIAAESLTVRAQDFHAVRRTISMRNDENIEIAEVHYDMLGWDAVNDTLFEPLGGNVATPSVTSALPHFVSPEQLDLAELQARLLLNRLHADSTVQLEFLRSQTSVEVKGVVESNVRKQELVSQLRAIPHILPAIFSVDDLRAHSESGNSVSTVLASSTVAQASPLEQFLRAQGKGTDTLNATSQRLLDAALSVKQESSAIAELYWRFGTDTQLDEAGKSILRQLLNAHACRLQQAVDAEDGILTEAVMVRPKQSAVLSSSGGAPDSLETFAENNMVLSKELISGKDGSQRDAALITLDLFRSTQELRNSLHGIASSNASPGQATPPVSQKR
jgi:anti-sigma factor RsiW